MIEKHIAPELRHMIALSHWETKRDYIRTMHSKLESSSPVCIQIGLNYSGKLDHVGKES